MLRTAIVVALLLMGALAPRALQAATQEQACRKAVAKGILGLYQATLKGTQGCYKTRIATSGATTDCLDPAQFDPGGKIASLTTKLADTMGAAGTCGPLGVQFAPSCTGAPVACAAACGSCGTGAAVAGCLACRVIELTKTQVAGLYGAPPDLSANSSARGCQNGLGSETAKYGRARMKEQQKCQQDVSANKLRAQCAIVDRKGKIAKANGKASDKILGKCLEAPGSDQIPALDAAAACLAGGTAVSAADCALASADTATDAIFALVSQPASVTGFVMTAGPGGALIPLPGVRIEVVGASLGQFTGRTGAYTLHGVPPGTQLVAIDGQRIGNYPRIAMGVPVGMVGETAMGIFAMPEIDMANAVDIGPMSTLNPNGSRTLTAPVTLSNPTIPDATLDLTASTVLTFDVPNRAPLLSLSMVPTNVMPFPTGAFSDQIFSFQPEGTTLSPSADATFPNNTFPLLPDGALVALYVPDFATNSFSSPGTGTVTTGGTLVEAVGLISSFDWHFIAPPSGCLTDVIGRVVDTAVVPIGGATVLAVGASAVTLSDGTFAIAGLPCPPVVVATAAVVTAGGTVLVGQSAPTITVFSGVTNVGDIVVGEPLCGNGTVNPPEECDDGAQSPGDGCSPTCLNELCLNGIIDPGEECDLTLGCSFLCVLCGNGLVRLPGEECDAGPQNGVAGSGCSNNCQISICGNGLVEDGEECDDGSANGGEFCSTACQIDILPAAFAFAAVRATLECTTPNDTWAGFVPSCNPPLLDSTFQFGPNGTGTFTASYAVGGGDALLHAQLNDVRDAGDVVVTDATGWELRAKVRITLRGGTNNVTLADTTISAAATLASPGVLVASLPVVPSTGVSFAAFTIHNVEILDMTMVDPTGGTFAARGHLVDQVPALTINTPRAAVVGSLEMAQAFVSCGNPGGNIPNGSVNGVPSCAPPETFAEQAGIPGGNWLFGPDTVLIVRSKANSLDVTLLGTGTGILDDTGFFPAFGSGSLHLGVRLTIHDPAGDMTVIDVPLVLPVAVISGKFVVKDASINTILQDLSLPPLSATQATILYGTLVDPNGNTFATLGIADGF